MPTSCPCINCPCIAMCRLKKYHQLIQCDLLYGYIEKYRRPIVSDTALWRIEMVNALQPTTWTTNMETGVFVVVKI